MIYVNRTAVDDAGRPIEPTTVWYENARKATNRAIAEGANHEFTESVYADEVVKAALERLFHDKCAYCETKSASPTDWDVEHFRPKGRVEERSDHPGYYWLAYCWQNLYFSCKHCNQRRKDRPRWDDPVPLPARGKADQFPLADETTRAMTPSDPILEETHLLIDPCSEDPEEYFGYGVNGEIFPIDDNRNAATTIDVLHLSRRRLRDHRRLAVQLACSILKLILSDEIPPSAKAELRICLDTNLKAPDSQHAAVARYVDRNPADFGV